VLWGSQEEENEELEELLLEAANEKLIAVTGQKVNLKSLLQKILAQAGHALNHVLMSHAM